MKISDFDYELPNHLIAQFPEENRTSSRLMVIERATQKITHCPSFSEIINYLQKGDVLVVNTTKVMPAKLVGERQTGGRVEILIIEYKKNIATVFIKVRKRPTIGEVYKFGEHNATVVSSEDGHWVLDFNSSDVADLMEQIGTPPLPPYIKRKDTQHNKEDQGRYQTVYAETLGAIAAPTAGLHFSVDLLKEIEAKGIEVIKVLLHVGLGTFLPVKVEDVAEHKMHKEFFEINAEAASKLSEAIATNRRIICVGTTSCRALESSVENKRVIAQKSETGIFIYPGYQFQAMQGLITNFHLPKSTLLLLISAFANKDFIMQAYKEAVEREYRFFSYGDAMLII